MSLAADICGALDFSHRNGIVHRDVKPGNVMITPQGTVKVMDFGIARAVSDSAATMTSTAAVIGTAQYLSPEQARGESVDARSDVYSMGCLLYELVTGAPPFSGDSPVAVAYQHVREDPRLPSSINPEVPPELDAILLKAMSKNPANRYQSAAEMRNDLLRALAGQRVEATPVMGDAEKTTILAAAPAGYGNGYGQDDRWDDEDEAGPAPRRKIIAIVSVLAVLLLGGAIAAAIALSGDKAPPATAQVNVPALLGLDQAAAEKAITDAGLKVGTVDTAASATVAQGQVISSDPASGASVDEGQRGEARRQRRARHRGRAQRGGTERGPRAPDPEERRVHQREFAAGRLARGRGQRRRRRPGRGPAGRQEHDDHAAGLHRHDQGARRRRQDRGRGAEGPDRRRVLVRPDPDRRGRRRDGCPGHRGEHRPGTGTAVGRGDTITLKVAKADNTRTVPDVSGQNEVQARATLAAAGFTNVRHQDTEGNGEPPGTAVGTDPAAGTKAAPDEEIVLLVVGG